MNASRLAGFLDAATQRFGMSFGAPGPAAYKALHAWSVAHTDSFHGLVWDFCGLIGNKGRTAVLNGQTILEAEFFPDSKISFAENMLARAGTHPNEPAIISRTAGIDIDRILTWKQLSEEVSRWEQALEKLGVSEGDRVATYLPHGLEAYILMIATAQRGAVFASVGTEMGAQATAARFAQIEPKILIAADGYTHMARVGQTGKPEDRTSLIAELQQNLPSLTCTIIVPNLSQSPDLSKFNDKTVLTGSVLQDIKPQQIKYTRRPFNQPLAILFSSGSTGKPKCFVHGVGGTLLKHAIEHQLQSDVRAGDRVFFHSTTSWMMFNWLASGLAQGATIMIYDGNPAYPAPDAQLRFAADHGCTHLGTAAAIVQDVWAKNNVSSAGLDLSNLRSLMYTGSVLSDKGYLYVDEHIKQGLSINGVCGGTDFVGCYAMGNAFTPTIAGQLKGAVLGMDIAVWDDHGKPVPEGTAGELVVKSAFASRPLYFLNDPERTKFRAEYFEYFANQNPPVWRHGDAVKLTPTGLIIEGRSDTTLNQGGVRIGTQMIYDALAPYVQNGIIEDSLAASFKDAQGGDHTALFIVMKSGHDLEETLRKKILTAISDSVGRLSTPHEVIAVPYLLKTPNGKRAEKPTSQAIKGEEVKAPETYGTADDGELKVQTYQKIAEILRQNPAYGFLSSEAKSSAAQT